MIKVMVLKDVIKTTYMEEEAAWILNHQIFVGLAKSFGANAIRVDDLSKVGEAASTALNNVGPTLIEVPCDFKHPGYGSFIDWSKE